jgi:hypothetical protein
MLDHAQPNTAGPKTRDESLHAPSGGGLSNVKANRSKVGRPVINYHSLGLQPVDRKQSPAMARNGVNERLIGQLDYDEYASHN